MSSGHGNLLTFGLLCCPVQFVLNAMYIFVKLFFQNFILLRWTLIGVTSAGFGCAVDKQPGIYHKVTEN